MNCTNDLLSTVLEAVQEAGNVVLGYYGGNFSVETKNDRTPVTTADLKAEETLLEGLPTESIGVISEEAGVSGKLGERYWVIDPLDGTKDFIQGTGEFALMVGLVRNGDPQLGVVYAPAQGKIWYGLKGEGAFLDDDGEVSSIEVSSVGEIEDYRMVVSRNHFREEYRSLADSLGITSFNRMGSLGLKYATIAEGNAELCVYGGGFLEIWDCCAPHLILEEAGGSVFDTAGASPTYSPRNLRMERGFIGTNGKNPEELLDAVNKEGL